MTRGPTLIGITGPIGCGKSTIAGWLAELGAVVVDADDVARDVLRPGEPAFGRVVKRFGPELLREDGSLDRAALGRIVFADATALADLEGIVHPAVRPRVLRRIAEARGAGARAVVVEAIKLVEGGLADLCDEVWLVACHPGAQRERLTARGLASDEIDARTTAQAGLADRLGSRVTRILETSGEPEATRAVVEAAFEDVIARFPDAGA